MRSAPTSFLNPARPPAGQAVRLLGACLLALFITACAGQQVRHDATGADTAAGSSDAVAELEVDRGKPGNPPGRNGNGNGNGEVFDPWEPFNRRVHNFNLRVDDYVARPLATFYRGVTPPPVRKGIGNFFANIYQPVTAVHLVLQGRPRQAGSALLRFTMNTTLGLAGFLDPATDAGLRQYNEDLGQTMGLWGWTESRYLVLPLFGSSTVRDAFGRVGDAPLNPLREINPERDRFLVQGVGLVDLRATLMDLGELEANAGDSYTLFRDTYLQRRRYQISTDEDQLPDYLFDDDLYDDLD